MSVSLQKGQKVSLSKDNQGLAQVIVGLGWDEVKRKGGLFSRKPCGQFQIEFNIRIG